jgi:hypothetical protein
MKKYTWLILILLSTIFAACNKNSVNQKPISTQLEGRWKMVLRIDSANGYREIKNDTNMSVLFFIINPLQGDVIMNIRFDSNSVSTGKMYGNTISNSFAEMNFTVTGTNNFTTIGGFWTLASDPPWGWYFYSGMGSAISFNFDNQQRLIINSLGQTLFFDRN